MASGFPSSHQRKLGPAPFASFEDLSDEHENGGGEAAQVARMPGIVEVTTPVTPANTLKTPSTPRIDISRASSSSHHEEDSNSHESTPEKELLAGTPPPEGCTLQLGYKEDVNDLRSSTEELDLQDPVHQQDLKREAKRARRRAKDFHDGTQSEHGISIKVSGDRERKDSNCSEIILLNISGRTSRLSSVGSQGSGVSGGLSVSAASSRSPSPHKCLLETSFCGSVSTLASTLIEPSKPETDDLAKLLLQREEDSTRAMIPESVRVPVVGGNLKPDQLDMPRRLGREERKEIFKREVEITKKVLKRVNIEVPIIKLPKEPDDDSIQKPATLDLNDRRKRSLSSASTSSRGGGTLETPKQSQRHQKVRDLEGSRTPSPSSVSRKSSFTSLFKGRADGASIQSQESPTTSSRRTSLASRLKDTADILRSRSKSRERGDKSPGARRSSRGSGVFSSTLSLFKKRERKKSGSSIGTPDTLDRSRENLDGIGHDYNNSYSLTSYYSQQQTPRKKNEGDVIFISLYGENDEFRYKDETPVDSTLPPESITSIPLESEHHQQQHEQQHQCEKYDASSPQQTSVNIVCTDATIEHHRRSRIRDRNSKDSARISSSSGESPKIPESRSRDSHISRSESRDSKVLADDRYDVTTVTGHQTPSDEQTQRLSTSSSRDSIGRKPDIPKPKRKKKPTTRPPPPPVDQLTSTTTNKPELNGKIPVAPSPVSCEQLQQQQHDSSESERDSETDFVKSKTVEKEVVAEELPDERKGLCYEESFEEDLPYVPTTLPLEKSVAIPILPIKQRVIQEVRTTPIERPRSTTPINPTLLDEFVHTSSSSHDEQQRRVEKMRISLPRDSDVRVKSPHRPLTAQHSFSEFAGRVPRLSRALSLTKSPSPPPPLPPRAPTTVLTTVATRPQNWINFEEIPEKRKAPKRIQTIPRLEGEPGHSQTTATTTATGQYSYVQPEECRCECHEESRRASLHGPRQSSSSSTGGSGSKNGMCNGENCQKTRAIELPTESAAVSGDRSSVVSDNSSEECSEHSKYTTTGRHRSDSRPFAMDLDVSSNRSSIISQDETEDDEH
ncbi:uncharacterized protein LOC131673798 isoform X1 [Phymastichus coffea]|uniref:uncharacterized protein LOC131673798 isoform X1 n=1 Tax=Phymastichus coffea TaxID=108790 RepID=UPI00273BB4C4|nr:uncharacterized protein LOC131673798 isoform X1 [Phymastichus coffea]XP_058808070.1 uncharacterized protein LOC131673798 isoform X1 [Phymastichus coffea]